MWEYQVELLTSSMRKANQSIEIIESRLDYIEKVLLTLIVALKQGGIIVDSDGSTESETYEV